METPKPFSVKLTRKQFEEIAPFMTKAGMRWAGGEKIEDYNPYIEGSYTKNKVLFYEWNSRYLYDYNIRAVSSSHPLRTFKSLMAELKQKKKTKKAAEYKLGEHFSDWKSLTPYKEGTKLPKGTLAVLMADDRVGLPLGTVMQVDEEDSSAPYLLPKYYDGSAPCRNTWELAPLPDGEPKPTKPTWTHTSIHERSDGIRLELNKITINGKEYTPEEAHDLEVKLRAGLKYWNQEFNK